MTNKSAFSRAATAHTAHGASAVRNRGSLGPTERVDKRSICFVTALTLPKVMQRSLRPGQVMMKVDRLQENCPRVSCPSSFLSAPGYRIGRLSDLLDHAEFLHSEHSLANPDSFVSATVNYIRFG